MNEVVAPAGSLAGHARLFFDLFKLRIGFAIGLTALAGALAVPGAAVSAARLTDEPRNKAARAATSTRRFKAQPPELWRVTA